MPFGVNDKKRALPDTGKRPLFVYDEESIIA